MPPASACQRSTTAPGTGVHPVAPRTLNASASSTPGCPSRTSLRTACASNQVGPAIVFGVSVQVPAPASRSTGDGVAGGGAGDVVDAGVDRPAPVAGILAAEVRSPVQAAS